MIKKIMLCAIRFIEEYSLPIRGAVIAGFIRPARSMRWRQLKSTVHGRAEKWHSSVFCVVIPSPKGGYDPVP